MNCDEFQSELERQLDAGLIVDNHRMREHCQICSACGEAWEGARLLADSIVAWRGQIPEVDLAEAVVAAYAHSLSPDVAHPLHRGERGRGLAPNSSGFLNSQRVRRRTALYAVATCVGALIGIALLAPSNDRDAPPPADSIVAVPRLDPPIPAAAPVHSTGTVNPFTGPIPAVAPTDELALLKAGAAYETFTNSAVGALEEFAWIVIPIRLTESATEAGEVSPARWIDSLQDHLQPFQQGLDDALDFLREAGDSPENSRT